MNCEINYCDWISCDDEEDILIATGQPDAASITAVISNKYRSEVLSLSIVDGNLVIPRNTGPMGWFNPYAGPFTVKLSVGCYDDPLFCGQYETVTFEVKNGTGKNSIVCPCAAQ